MIESVSPWVVAEELGIRMHEAHGADFRVATMPDCVAYAWHPDETVRTDRAWEGIAQCLLERYGVPWSEVDAAALARFLRAPAVFFN